MDDSLFGLVVLALGLDTLLAFIGLLPVLLPVAVLLLLKSTAAAVDIAVFEGSSAKCTGKALLCRDGGRNSCNPFSALLLSFHLRD